ncbi:TBC1 domain family member 24 [Paragonimus heterotremus]|uniref:TBC1 domain family member 24 n=1 Tax=Paragonimus heterotremus TaxID=100268 RepID=A0A8J4TLL8_9TREM|nr:TBC1 domain family member 24 [Paragonimus heterotremus]
MSSPFSRLTTTEVEKFINSYTNGDIEAHKQLIHNAAKGGIKQLKLTMRRLNLPPSHPARSFLWPLLISTKYAVPIPKDNAGPDTMVNGTEGRPDVAGYELSDKTLLPVFHLNETGQQHLRHLLHTIAINHPHTVYAPQLWPLLALFLHYHPTHVSEACLLTLLNQTNVLTQTKNEWKEHCLALEFLGRAGFISKAEFRAWRNRSSVTKNNSSLPSDGLSIQLARWAFLLWQLPFDHLVRMVDCYLLEGTKVFYRAGLTLWKIAAKSDRRSLLLPWSTLGTFTTADLLKVVSQIPLTPSLLLKRMFAIINFSCADIRKAIEKVRTSENSLLDQPALDELLIQPCTQGDQATCATYLLTSDATSSYVHPSECVSVSELASLITSIGDKRFSHLSKPILLFSTNRDGTSLHTLYARAASAVHAATLLLVRTTSEHSVIGAFCTDRWHAFSKPTYFGSGWCFLFRVRPGPLSVYPWVGLEADYTLGSSLSRAPHTDCFQLASKDGIQIGGAYGSGQPGLSLNKHLSHGTSGPCPTFGNPCLITDPGDKTELFGANHDSCAFSVGLVELIGFLDL